MKELKHLSPVNTLLSWLICGLLALGVVDLQAAKRPMSQNELEKESELIVTGKVIVAESKVQKSQVERGFGVHRDRIYTIKLAIKNIHKMCPNRAFLKDVQIVEAWEPATRIPPSPGLQGHESIPQKGDIVKMYLKWNKAKKLWEPLLPNGIEITKKAKKTK